MKLIKLIRGRKMSKEQQLNELYSLKNALEQNNKDKNSIDKIIEAMEVENNAILRRDLPEYPEKKDYIIEKRPGKVELWTQLGTSFALILAFVIFAFDLFGRLTAAGGTEVVLIVIFLFAPMLFPLFMGFTHDTDDMFDKETIIYHLIGATGYISAFLFYMGAKGVDSSDYSVYAKLLTITLAVKLLVYVVVSIYHDKYNSKSEKRYFVACDSHKHAVKSKMQKNAIKYAGEIQECEQKHRKELAVLFKRTSQNSKIIESSKILHDDDKNLYTIKSLINLIERKRADSIKEALVIFDSTEREKGRAIAEAQMDAWRELRALEEQWQRDREQFWHNQAMLDAEKERAEQAKRAADELERIRKDIEEQ